MAIQVRFVIDFNQDIFFGILRAWLAKCGVQIGSRFFVTLFFLFLTHTIISIDTATWICFLNDKKKQHYSGVGS
jgi:hypothetical protein